MGRGVVVDPLMDAHRCWCRKHVACKSWSGNIHMMVSSEEFLKPSVKLHKNLVIVYSFSFEKKKNTIDALAWV